MTFRPHQPLSVVASFLVGCASITSSVRTIDAPLRQHSETVDRRHRLEVSADVETPGPEQVVVNARAERVARCLLRDHSVVDRTVVTERRLERPWVAAVTGIIGLGGVAMVAGGARRLARGEAFTEVDPGADLIRTFDDERGMTRGGRLVTIGGVLTPLLIPTVISLVRARNTVDRVGELDLASDRVEECGRAPLAEEQLQLMADGAVLGASATNASGAAEFQLDPVRVPTALTWVAGETRGPVSQAVADAISAATRERADRISRERRAAQAAEYQAVVAREIENGRCSADSESILAPTISALGQQVRRDWVIDSHGVMIVTDHAFLVTGPTPTAHRLSPSLAGEYTVVARSRGAISIRVLTETGGQVSRGTDVGSTLVLNLGYEPHWAHGTFVSNGRDPYRLEITGQGCVLITLVYRP